MQEMTGRQIGQYLVMRRLGTGGMAVVYQAKDLQTGQVVAIKLIRTEAIPAEQHQRLLQRFARECSAMARLSHPHIVAVHDYGEAGGVPYMVMDYLPGETLKRFTGGMMDYRMAAQLLAPIADALAYAHARGIIHRDVKPSNILMTHTGKPMLTDFGVAKLLDDPDAGLTGTGLGVGTPQYMAPEQWKGKTSPQTDVYALGTIFYELITGRKPYTADTPAAIAIMQATEPLVRPRQYNGNIPEAVERVIFRALAFKAENRHASMEEFHQVLVQLAGGVLPVETPVMGSEDMTYDALSEPAQVMPLRQPRGRGVVQEDAAAPKKKKKWWLAMAIVAGLVLCVALVWGGVRLMDSLFGSNPETAMLVESMATAAAKAGDDGNDNQEKNMVAPTSENQTVIATTTTRPTNQNTDPVATAVEENLGAGSSFIRSIDGMTVMYIPEGSFIMGASSSNYQAYAHEKPAHEVQLDAFWMDAYEVSNAMFLTFVKDTGYLTQAEQQGYSYMYGNSGGWDSFTGVNWLHPMGAGTSYKDDLPVVHVNFYDAEAYCSWAGGRLPTEAEWEKAARGSDERIYPWGNNFNGAFLRFDSDAGPASVFFYTDGVSPFGIFNMAGNVFEWTRDWYDAGYYATSPNIDPTGPMSGEQKVLRGGSWNNSEKNVRTTHRDTSGPDYMNYLLGFRCVMDAE